MQLQPIPLIVVKLIFRICIEAVWFKCLFSTSIQSNEVVKSVLYKLEMQQLPQKY